MNQKRLDGFIALHAFALAALLCAVYFASIAGTIRQIFFPPSSAV